MSKFKEKFDTAVQQYKEKVENYVGDIIDKGSENVVEVVVPVIGVYVAVEVAKAVFDKMFPSRTNVHVYIHIK